jgi:hypothetical protein
MAYEGYRGRCIGRLMQFCYKMTCFSDSWCFGNGTISNSAEGKVIGHFAWEGNTDIPLFCFTDSYYTIYNDLQFDTRKHVAEYDEWNQKRTGIEPWDAIKEHEKEEALQVARSKRLWDTCFEYTDKIKHVAATLDILSSGQKDSNLFVAWRVAEELRNYQISHSFSLMASEE